MSMPITTTFLQVVTPSIQITTGTVRQVAAPGYQTVNVGGIVSSTVTNWITGQIRDIVGLNTLGYGLGAYFSVPVNTSTRVTARTYNSILTDLDLVLRHITSASIVSTVTQLSTWTNALVVNTGSVVSATQWQSLVNLVDFCGLNRYSIHPGQLAQDVNGCTVSYDQSISYRTTSWGTGTSSVITMEVRAQWPTAQLADSFFNTGGDFVFSPFVQSMSFTAPDPTATGTNLTVQTALDTADIQVPLSVSGNGIGVGPIFHVDFGQWPYGAARAVGSTDYFYTPGSAVSGNAAYLNQNPRIWGTPFQFVGLHYGDYTTQLVIGVRQGQSVPLDSTVLTVTLNNDTTKTYTVTVPGYLDRYLGPNAGSLTGVNGWWIWEDDGVTAQDRLVSWIEIYSGRKGSDPIGLGAAIGSRQPFSLQIVPGSLAPGSASSSTGVGSTVTNTWAQFIDELRAGQAQSYSYDRARWRDSNWQTTTSIFTSTIGTNTNQISIVAQRNSSTVGQSNYINFVVSATNFAVGNVISYYHPYTYTTSSQTCTNLVSADNATDGATGNFGGGGSGFPWWIVAVGIVSVVTGVCFTGPTLITMEDGSRRPIRDLRPGDRVRGYRPDTVNTVRFVEHKLRESVPLVSPDNSCAPFITDNHPIIEDGHWISADPDQHWRNYPWLGPAQPMKQPQLFHSPGERVYNLWVDGDHTYWVNDWATTSIIGDGSFLRISVEQGHITEEQAIEILDNHATGSRNLIVGSYYVNHWLGRINSDFVNRTISQCLAGPDSIAKAVLRGSMSTIGIMACAALEIKYKLLGMKPKI